MTGALPRVVLTRPVPPGAFSRLCEKTAPEVWMEPTTIPPAELRRRAADAVGLLVVSGERVDEELLAAAPELRVVSTMSVGYDHVDVSALTARGLPLGNTPGVLTEATADLAFALLLAVARRLVEARDAVLTGRWGGWDPEFLLGRELAGSTLGIVGLGRIGAAVARRALAFGMEVLASTTRTPELEGIEVVELPSLLERSEFVSLHVALTPATRHLIGARELATMRRDAILINTARGGVVDQVALAAALRDGTIAAAGLDVAEVEPVPPGDELLCLDNCLVLPHVGSATRATREKMAELAVANLIAGVNGEPLLHCVNAAELGAPRPA